MIVVQLDIVEVRKYLADLVACPVLSGNADEHEAAGSPTVPASIYFLRRSELSILFVLDCALPERQTALAENSQSGQP